MGDLAVDGRVVEVDEDVRPAEVAVVLRDLVLEDQVVPPRVPGELADEPVVLVEVVAVVREDQIGPDLTLELLEEPLHVLAAIREERVGKAAERDLERIAVAADERPCALLRLPRPPLVLAADDDPVDAKGVVRALEPHQRPAAADLEVVRVGAESEDLEWLVRLGPAEPDHGSPKWCTWSPFQTAHGGRPLSISASRLCLSLSVSSGAQKPS